MRRLLLILVTLAAVACAGSTEPETTTTTTTVAAPTTTTHPVTPGTIPPFVEVELAVATGPLGDHLVDAAGMSLYMFALDDERTSTCEGPCAALWPPFLGDPVAADGVDQELAGNAERSDGSIQVTYGGHPLYYYAEDTAPGDVGGHGFNDVWFLVSPSGTPLNG